MQEYQQIRSQTSLLQPEDYLAYHMRLYMHAWEQKALQHEERPQGFGQLLHVTFLGLIMYFTLAFDKWVAPEHI